MPSCHWATGRDTRNRKIAQCQLHCLFHLKRNHTCASASVSTTTTATTTRQENAGSVQQILPTALPGDHVSHADSRDFASHAPGPGCDANAESTSLDRTVKFAVALVQAHPQSALLLASLHEPLAPQPLALKNTGLSCESASMGSGCGR